PPARDYALAEMVAHAFLHIPYHEPRNDKTNPIFYDTSLMNRGSARRIRDQARSFAMALLYPKSVLVEYLEEAGMPPEILSELIGGDIDALTRRASALGIRVGKSMAAFVAAHAAK